MQCIYLSSRTFKFYFDFMFYFIYPLIGFLFIYYENLTDLRETVETGMDPCLCPMWFPCHGAKATWVVVKVKLWQAVLQERTITCKNTVIFLSSAPCKLNWASPLFFCFWLLRSDATFFLFSLTFSVGRHKTVNRCRCFMMTIHTCGMGKSEAYIRTEQKDNGSTDICRIVLKVSILHFQP